MPRVSRSAFSVMGDATVDTAGLRNVVEGEWPYLPSVNLPATLLMASIKRLMLSLSSTICAISAELVG